MAKHRSPIWFIDKNELEKIVDKSENYSQVLKHFGLFNKGRNCTVIKERLKFDNISTNHFKKRLDYLQHPVAIDYKLVLVENSNYTRNSLKRRLINDKVIDYKCQLCNIQPYWNHKELILVLDHINGINNDNRLENLRFLCPNCHSQTPTFSGRNNYKRKTCENCGKINKINQECGRCKQIERSKGKYITKEILEKEVWQYPSTILAKKYNISGPYINKLCNKFKINKPNRGYWSKFKSKQKTK